MIKNKYWVKSLQKSVKNKWEHITFLIYIFQYKASTQVYPFLW